MTYLITCPTGTENPGRGKAAFQREPAAVLDCTRSSVQSPGIMPPPRLRSLPAATKIFVHREGPLRIFDNAAFDIPADSARLWHRWAGQDGAVPGVDAENRQRSILRVSAEVELDLDSKPKADPDLLLVWIRNGFVDAGVALPCFDLARAIVREATRGEQPFPKLSRPGWYRRKILPAKTRSGRPSLHRRAWVKPPRSF
jgi:hypothetical protein